MLLKMKSRLVLLFVFVTWSARDVSSRSNGDVEEACNTMVPNHANDPQDSASPYTIVPDITSYNGSETITLVISGGTFKGFFVQARRVSDDSRIGTFTAGTDQRLLCDNVRINYNNVFYISYKFIISV